MKNILIENIDIELSRKNIKNINLSIHPPDGRVRLSVPKKMGEEAIRNFIVSKLAWIKKHKSRFHLEEKSPEKE